MMIDTPDYSPEYAAVYDIITSHKDYAYETELLASTISEHTFKNNGCQVLSVGCGTGSHEILLARKGFEVTGIDISSAMINEAHSKKHPLLRFAQLSLEDFSKINQRSVDAVACLFNVINCLPNIESLVDFFASTSAVMRDGSFLFLECWNAIPCMTAPPQVVSRSFTCPNNSYNIERVAIPYLNLINQKLCIEYQITGTYKMAPIHIKSLHNITLFTRMEIRYALEMAGLSRIKFSNSLSDSDTKCSADESRMNSVSAYKLANSS